MQLTYSGGGREDRNGLYLFLGERIVRYHPGIFTFSKMSFFRYVSVFLNNFCYLPPLHFFLCWTKGLNFTAAFVETATVLLVSKTSATLIFLRRLSSFLVFRISHCQKKKRIIGLDFSLVAKSLFMFNLGISQNFILFTLVSLLYHHEMKSLFKNKKKEKYLNLFWRM